MGNRAALKWTSALAAAALMAAACGAQVGSQAPGASSSGGGAAGDRILIGSTLSLTGIQAPLDEPGLRGAQLAVKELNKKGGILGKQVDLINLDGKSDPVVVGNVALELIQKGAQAIIAPCDFDFGGPASREAQKAGIVGISTCASSPLYGSKSLGDKQFTLSMWNTTMGASGAEWGYTKKGWRTAYVVTDTFIDYTKSLSRYFIATFKHLGGEVFAEDTYTQGAQDFSAQLQRIKALPKQPDVLYISSYMPDLGTIIKTIRAAGITTPVMGGDSYDDPQLSVVLGADRGNDVFYATHSFMSAEAGANVATFLDLYKAEYSKDPDTAFVVTGWDVVNVMAEAMTKANTTDGAAVAKAMEGTEFTLLTGHLTWSNAADGHRPDKEAVIAEITAGKTAFQGWFRPTWLPEP